MGRKQYPKWQWYTAGIILGLGVLFLTVTIANISHPNNSSYGTALESPAPAAVTEADLTTPPPAVEAAPPADAVTEPPVATPEPPKPVTFTNVIAGLDKATVKADIKADAQTEWGTDFRMVKYQIDQQTEAYNSLIRLKITDGIHETILNDAYQEWANDFRMVKYQYEKQNEAYNSLQ